MKTRWSTWTTNSGAKVRVKNMADQHLLNVHCYMQREIANFGDFLSLLSERITWCSDGGDAAEEAEEWIAAFAGEIRRRKLQELPLEGR